MMQPEPAAVSICVLTFNRSALLKELLLSLSNLKYRPLEVIVVDNHSEDETPGMMGREFSEVIYFRTQNNEGAGARNIGMQRAGGEIIITLDDDIMGIDDHAIEVIISLFSNPRIGAVNFRIQEGNTGKLCNWVHHCKEEDYGDKEFLTYEITEGAVAFRKKAVNDAGYYPQCFFLSYEGPDLAARILDCGYDVIYTGQVAVKHYHSNAGRKDWLNYYYDTRNQFWLVARLFPPGYAIFFLSRGLLANLVYSVRDGYVQFWAKGILDGIRGVGKVLRDRRVLGKTTMALIRAIDRERPGIIYLLRKRLFRRGMRL